MESGAGAQHLCAISRRSRRRNRKTSVDAGGRRAAISRRNAPGGNLNVFQAAADHLKALQAAGKRVLVASWTEGSAERMGGVLSDHGVDAIRKVADWPEALKLRRSAPSASPVWASSTASRRRISPSLREQDVLGDRMVRRADARAPGAEFPLRSLGAGAGRSGHPYRAWRRAAISASRPSTRWARRMTAWSCNMTAASCSCRWRISSS